MVEFIDILLHKRRFLIAGVFIIVDMFLISILASAAQAHHLKATPHTNASVVPTSAYNSPNVITNAGFMLTNSVGQTANAASQKALSGIDSIALGAAKADKAVIRGAHASLGFTARVATRGSGDVIHAVGVSFGFVGRTVIGGSLSVTGHAVFGGLAFVGHVMGGTFGFVAHVTHINSVIRVSDHTPTPTITQLRIQQAALIQSGTKDVLVTSKTRTSGIGGACDIGNGNGGYPITWCNAAMDTVTTIPYSGDPINRECTSYAYWYFTSVEGHAGFKVWGNAKDWATTSNYPTHAMPAVGAIAVETAGAFGHVAIVQALPGQKYASQVVPAGYVLVSEMNYDWNGHFRYSYSPLSKFSAYIYP